MRYFLMCLFLGFWVATNGCNGNAGTQGAQQVTIITPGTPQTFNVEVFNGTQFPLYLAISANGGGASFSTFSPSSGNVLIVYPGTAVMTDLGFLPQSIQVDAVMQRTPFYQYPTRTFILGTDFNYWNNYYGLSYY